VKIRDLMENLQIEGIIRAFLEKTDITKGAFG
jgi:hypothetical protein